MARQLKVGASDGIRTRDGRNHNPGLYQLSYARHRGPRKLYRNAPGGAPDGAPGGTRTPDRRIRNPLLYPAELRAHGLEGAAPECSTGRLCLTIPAGAGACQEASWRPRVLSGWSAISRRASPVSRSAAPLRSPSDTIPTSRLLRSTTG